MNGGFFVHKSRSAHSADLAQHCFSLIADSSEPACSPCTGEVGEHKANGVSNDVRCPPIFFVSVSPFKTLINPRYFPLSGDPGRSVVEPVDANPMFPSVDQEMAQLFFFRQSETALYFDADFAQGECGCADVQTPLFQ